MDALTTLITAAVVLAVGLLVGWTGVAGFLLPIFFTSYLGLDIAPALTLSFCCFGVCGVIGAVNYHRAGELSVRPGLFLGAGSLAGALVGAALNQQIPGETVKILLYVVVLLSGASILLRREKADAPPAKPVQAFWPLAGLGVVTGLICALSGAGGPVLVMPLLLLLGFPAHTAVGTALFDSIFIAVPSIAVYWSQGAPAPALLAVCVLAHGVGVLAGSRTSGIVPGKLLKKLVGVFSVCVAVYMLLLR